MTAPVCPLNLIKCPRAMLYRVYEPYSTLPSGRTVGEDEDWSSTLPSPGRFVVGSTPKFTEVTAPNRHVPLAGVADGAIGINTPQPSGNRLRIDLSHLRVRFGL